MAGFGSPLAPRRRLAAELSRLRRDSGLTGAAVAATLGWSASKVSRYELGRTSLKEDEVGRLLDLYDVGGVARSELLALAAETGKRGWWETYADVLPEELAELIGLENDARAAFTWQMECVPGLLQTPDYASQVNRGFQEVVSMPPRAMERRVRARLRRQEVLTRARPLVLDAVIDESALLRRVADPPVMAAQLAHLLVDGARPNVTIRVLPLAASQAIILPSFVVMEFAEDRTGTIPDVAYIEHLDVNLYIEDENHTYRFKEAYERFAASALPPAQSAELISDVARRVWSDS
jgi:transcriptional regulator with XRE-family HTH domain